MNRLFYRILSSKFGAFLEINILMRQTAKVFDVDAPSVGFSNSELLKTYAQFTADISMKLVQSKQDTRSLQQDLYNMAYRLGKCLRWWLRPQNKQDCLAIIIMLYRHISIQIREESAGIFCVDQCYFSAYFTPEICFIISAIDQGIFAGVYQGGKLSFCERITEGYEVCIADFQSDNVNEKHR